jgi:hypothetical protein
LVRAVVVEAEALPLYLREVLVVVLEATELEVVVEDFMKVEPVSMVVAAPVEME